ncbi:calcium-binding protein [Oleomonas cavernae]|uniref:Calcium-binding protein n=1 Tax=Oleomonas cavernae TaxID=2320859 RepID=A0A418WDH9_9PROT|nr:calcium-binding protein [Oleomonas cavernae]RJF87999.1 calcium-binding protein [Oleomonas cavernae]
MATFTGSNSAEVIPDLIIGPVQGIGNDFVDALGGDDIAIGWSGDDVIRGGAGGDVIIGGLLNAAGIITLSGIDAADYTTSVDGVTIDLSVLISQTLPRLGINIQLNGASQGFGGDAQGDYLVGIVNLIGSNTGGDTLTGSAAANTMNGQGGDDTLNGGGGNDILLGGAGLDLLTGGAGADSLQGGAFLDSALYGFSPSGVTVNLTTGTGLGGDAQGDTLTGIENVVGSAFIDVITGDANSNSLQGLGGDDTLNGVGGDDVLIGGAGADILNGGAGTNTAVYDTSSAGVQIDLSTGTTVVGQGGDAQSDQLTDITNLVGSGFNDVLGGTSANNGLNGGLGDDRLTGGAGGDQLIGGDGLDMILYSASSVGVTVDLGLSTASGGDAQGDTLSSIENVIGSNFADSLTGNAGDNRLYGLDGDDLLNGGDGADTLLGGVGTDNLTGGVGNDVLKGDDGTDTLTGNEGNDRLDGGVGADSMAGGLGDDTYFVDDAGDIVTEAAGEGSDRVYAAVSYSLDGAELENLFLTGTAVQGDGNGFDNVITGNGADNVLNGGIGVDRLKGMDGADILNGGAGKDYLYGGAGADHFVFDSPGSGADAIGDWEAGIDKIDLNATGFGLAVGPVTVVNGTSSQGLSGDVLFYQTNTGRLYFHDGDTEALTLFASFGTARPAGLSDTDFVLV